MLGASFLLGGIKYHTQEYNRVSAHARQHKQEAGAAPSAATVREAS
jgi:hypothetical protein